MARKLDWFPFYAAAFQTDEAVRLMDCFQVGCYTLLLSHQWINGSLPTEESQALALLQPWLSPLAGDDDFRRARDLLNRCFPPSDDDPTRRQNRRLEIIRAEQVQTRERLSEAGKKGGRPKGSKSSPEKPGFSISANPGFAREKRREEKKKERGAHENRPDAWVDRFAVEWEALIGMASKPKLLLHLSPLVRAHGVPQVFAAWQGYLREGKGKPWVAVTHFANTYLAIRDRWATTLDEAGQELRIPSEPGRLEVA